jgi:hypothetical protein
MKEHSVLAVLVHGQEDRHVDYDSPQIHQALFMELVVRAHGRGDIAVRVCGIVIDWGCNVTHRIEKYG